MKRKLLVFAPLMALMVSGCFARLPTNSSGKAPTTTGTSGSGSGSDSSSSGSSEEPGDLDFGSEGHELSLAQAKELFDKIVEYDEDSGKYSTYTEKPVYVKAKVKSDSVSSDVHYVNIYDGDVEITVYRANVPEDYKSGGKMAGKTAYVYGYATKFVKNEKLTYELTYKAKDDASTNPTVYKVEDPEPTPGTNYGTLDNPLTITEAKAIIDVENPTASKMYVTGKISKNDAYNESYKNTNIWIEDDDHNEFELYGCNLPSGFTPAKPGKDDAALVGKVVVASGTGKLYKTTYEFDKNCNIEKFIETDVPVDGISVNPTSLTLENNGATGSFAVVVSPSNATNKDFSVVSGNTNVATVTKDGSNVTVTPLVAGSSTVTVTSADNPQFTAKCEVTVNTVDATGVTVSPKTETLLAGGQSKTLTAEVAPANATNKTVTWASDKPSIVSVGETTGVITPGSSAGTAIITATDHKGHTDSCTVTVTSTVVHVSSVEFESAYKTLVLQANGSSSAALSEHVTVLPTDALDKSLTFTSNNPSVATVDQNTGVVNPHIEGTATITVTSVDNPDATDTCAVTVNKIPVSSVTLDKHELALNVDGTETLTATVNPDNATYKGVSWESSNPSVATVSNGVVTAKAEGTATITVESTDDTSIADICVVTVTAVANHGTLESPISVADARSIIASFSGDVTTYDSDGIAYVRGVVTTNVSKGSSGDLIFEIGATLSSTDTIKMYYAGVRDGVNEPIQGETVVVSGTLCDYVTSDGKSHTYEMTGNNKVTPAIEKPYVEKVEAVTPTGLNLATCPGEVVVGSSINLTGVVTPTGARGEINWSIKSGGSYASLSEGNKLTGTAAGTVVVTGTVKGTSISSEKSITVTADAPVSQTVTILPSDGTPVDGGSTGKEFSMTKNGITITAVGTLTSDQARVFKGKTMTITGATFTKLVITCTATGTTKQGPGCWGAGAPEGYTFEAAGKTGTWEGNVVSLSFTATDNQVRITQFVITYSA